jgi:universal stress protein E
MKNILLATDFTPNSDRAMSRAIRISKETAANLYILHILPPYPLKKVKKLSRSLKDELQELLHKQVESHHGGNNIKTYVNVIDSNDIYTEILNHAYSIKADLIVMGMHSKTKMRDYFVGTNLERVIRSGLKPVLLVKNTPIGSYQNIVSGIDYSPGCRAALRMAEKLAPRADFYAIHAYDIPYYAEKTYKYAVSRALVEERHQNDMDKFLREETAYLNKQSGQNGKITGKLVPGKPYAVLTKKVRTFKADLLTIGAHGDVGFVLPGTKLGGTALEMLFNPPCDVLVVNNWKDMSQMLI